MLEYTIKAAYACSLFHLHGDMLSMISLFALQYWLVYICIFK